MLKKEERNKKEWRNERQ